MGKKSKKGKSVTAESSTGMPRHVRREIMEIVNILLEKCSAPFGSNGTEWNDFMDVYQLVEKLRKKQQTYVLLNDTSREQHIPAFLQWLTENGVDISAVTIDQFGEAGYGLKATRDFEEADLMLSIPRKIMMTSATAKVSALGPLIQEDRILQTMPNVVMSLHLLCEISSLDSFWEPYLKTLPSVYTTPLYFTPEEILLLKASPAQSEILNQFRNLTRQYAYFFRLFQGLTNDQRLPIKNFCFDDYRWAVSTVMTRQNQIPALVAEEADTALIPLWDMCNHTCGQITTDYNDKTNCSECYAVRRFSKGDQVMIFYGPRSNSEFLIHNGFIYDENEYDRLAIRIGVSKNDHLYSMKAEVLARLPLSTNRVFYLYANKARPIDSDLIAYLRVFAMDQDTLLLHLIGEDVEKRRQALKEHPFSTDNEVKAWSFLETRAQLLLKSYQTTIEEDDVLLANGNLSAHASLAVRLRRIEKNILLSVAYYASFQKLLAMQGSPDHDGHCTCDSASHQHGQVTFDSASHQHGHDIGDSASHQHGHDTGDSASHQHQHGQVQITSVPIATGEEQFVRIEGAVHTYGSMEERAAVEAEFRNSVLRGDYLKVSKNDPNPPNVGSIPVTSLCECDVREGVDNLKIEEVSHETT